MKWTQLKLNIFWILFIAIIVIIGYYVGRNRLTTDLPVEDKPDTIYNIVTIDSIEYNIIKKDSIIVKLKYEYETKIIEVANMSDSASVELFKELCTDDFLYGRDK